MAQRTDNRKAYRCVSCEQVDVPTWAGPGPGWIAGALWGLALLAWAGTWWLEEFALMFWALLLVALAYTLWYFYRRERACRHCGSTRLDPAAAPSAPGAP